MTKRKTKDSNIVSTREAVSIALGIPVEHVKAAKVLNCPAASTTGRYYLSDFKEWYDKNKTVIEEYLEDNDPATTAGKGIDFEKERKERALASIAEIELKERQHKSLDRDMAINTFKRILDSQAIILRNMAQVLPIKLEDKKAPFIEIELAKSYDEFCSIFTKGINEWKQKL